MSLSLLPLGTWAQGARPTRGGELKVALYSAPSNLDPIAGTSGSDSIILDTYAETLVRFDEETLRPTPGLAKSWEFTQPNLLVLTIMVAGTTPEDERDFGVEGSG